MFLFGEKKLRKIVRDNYEDIAADFDSTRQKELPQAIYDVAQRVKSGESVLDAACGNGRLLKGLENKELNYLGFDASHNLLALAQKNWPQNKFVAGDLLDSATWPQETFDKVFCLAAWHHVPGTKKQLEVLVNLSKCLKPQGELVVSVWDFYGQRKFWGKIIKSYLLLRPNELIFPWKKNNSLRYYHAFSRLALHSLVKKSGLQLKEEFAAGGNYYLILGLKKL